MAILENCHHISYFVLAQKKNQNYHTKYKQLHQNYIEEKTTNKIEEN